VGRQRLQKLGRLPATEIAGAGLEQWRKGKDFLEKLAKSLYSSKPSARLTPDSDQRTGSITATLLTPLQAR
jgi:hypothetical protein